MNKIITLKRLNCKIALAFITVILLLSVTVKTNAQQLGVYDFTGVGICPNQNPAVTTQPTNASFSNFSSTGVCKVKTNEFSTENWETTNTLNFSKYNQFTLTPNTGYGLNLTSISFDHRFNVYAGTKITSWALRSSLDGFTTDLGTGTLSSITFVNKVVTLPAAFTNIASVTFRFYLLNAETNSTDWIFDNITVNGTVTASTTASSGYLSTPTSNSPQNFPTGVTMNVNGVPPAGKTWYWQTSATGTSTAIYTPSYTVYTSGTYYVREQDNTTLAWSPGAGSLSVVVNNYIAIYEFTGVGTCPNQNPAVTAQPANAVFSDFIIAAGGVCKIKTNEFSSENWNITNTINLAQYNQITVTASPGYVLNLTSLSFDHRLNTYAGTKATNWVIRSSIDNYTTNLATGPEVSIGFVNDNVPLSAAFTNISNVTFRFYLNSAETISSDWIFDNIMVNGTVNLNGPVPGDPVNPTSNSPQCASTGVTMNFTGTPPADETWFWQTSATGISTTNSSSSYTVTTSGTYYVRSRNNTTLRWSTGAGSVTVVNNSNVTTPVFASGNATTRCQSAATITYTASANNNTGITYSLDNAAAGTIIPSTGTVTYNPSWSGTVTITASAAGCSGPLTADHTATTISLTPYALTVNPGIICANTSTTVTMASSQLGINYRLRDDATNAQAGAPVMGTGAAINFNTGAVAATKTFNVVGELLAANKVLAFDGINDYVSVANNAALNPVNITTECWVKVEKLSTKAAMIMKTDPASTLGYGLGLSNGGGGNKFGFTVNNDPASYIESATTITLNTWYHVAATFNGAQTKIYINGVLETSKNYAVPIGVSSKPLMFGSYQGTANQFQGQMDEMRIWKTARTAADIVNTMNIALAGNEANLVAYYTCEDGTGSSILTDNSIANFNGTLINMDVNAAWVNQPGLLAVCSAAMANTVTVNVGNVTNPVFATGLSTTRCQGAGNVTYNATATFTTGITYSLDGPSITGLNTIDPNTGEVTYNAAWSGTTKITASAAGCTGPKQTIFTVTVTPTVPAPTFASATSSICQTGSAITLPYTATTATPNTGLVYSLDQVSLDAGNSITAAGVVTFATTWAGTTTISVYANGCNGPSATSTHVVTVKPLVVAPTLIGALPASPRCQGAGSVSYESIAFGSTSITYGLDGASNSGGNSITSSGVLAFAPGWAGSTTVTVTANGCGGPKYAIYTIVTTPSVGAPVFTSPAGTSSTRCQGAGTTTYTATATNKVGNIIYSIDATSSGAGNYIDPATGTLTFIDSWVLPVDITATANGCNGPKSSIHRVNITPRVGVPVFTVAPASPRCQGASYATFTATASNAISISYSIDNTTNGNGINSGTGVVTFGATFSGPLNITATATGCNGSTATAVYPMIITPTVGTPVFATGLAAKRCQGAGTVTFNATASATTGITYSLSQQSLNAGNTIDITTGAVTYLPTWKGIDTVTASAAGCNGPATAIFKDTTTATVGTPVFVLGMESVRDQLAETVIYSATSTNNTGITYSLDQASLDGGNTISTSTGAVVWAVGWYGTSAITATATGCNGPVTASHIVIINTAIVQTPLYLSDPGLLLDRVDPVAANIIPTAITPPISQFASGINIDAQSIATGTSSSISLSHTTGTGSNRLMLVGISQPNRTVTSVTYGSSTLTLVGQDNVNGSARIAIYQLINPPSGTATVTINFSSSVTRGAVVSVTTYTGVNQSNPLGNFASANGKTTSPNVGANSATGEMVYDVTAIDGASPSVGSGQTERWNTFSGNTIYGAGSTKPAASGLTNMNWSIAINNWAIGAVSIKPALYINTISFTQSPALCSDLVIKSQTIQMLAYVKITSGTMPVNPAITATLKYDATTIISLSNPVYNSSTKILSWTGTLATDKIVPAGKSLQLVFTSAQPGVEFQIEYHSKTKPSRISLLPVSTFVDFVSFDVFNAPYPGGTKRTSGNVNSTYYVRGVVTTPFGYSDITGLDIKINPPGTTVPVACVDSTACTRTYELAWTTSPSTGMYYLLGIAKEGFENLIKNSDLESFDVCSVCPPIALADSGAGGGGAPILVDVLANDYDPNNNLKLSTLTVTTQGNNGTGYISNNKIVYLPNGSFAGKDTITYTICDSTGLCATAKAYFVINPLIVDPCSEATQNHVYYLPFSENEARIALDSSTNQTYPSNDIRTVISLKMPYPGMTIVWDQWEDGYELNSLNPLQSTTQVWGDGNPYNGIAPGYSTDIIPAGGGIVLDNTIPTNPRVASNLFYDGKDKITASGQITVTQVSGEPSIMDVQCMKTNVSATLDYGRSFTIPVGQNYNSTDFQYTSLFIRAAQDNTTVLIDKDNNGTLETSAVLNEGEVMHVNGGVYSGATVTANGLIGVEFHSGGNDNYSSRDEPIFPATWYSHTYYTPVPTVKSPDSAAVFLYNNLSRPININWTTTATPTSGTITLAPKTTTRFALALSASAAYKFVNPTGESFTAIEMCDSYTPGKTGAGNKGTEFDWSFNLIAENRLTDFATIAWAPGSINGARNDNPIWVTPTATTDIYVKYDGKISGSTGLNSGCGFKYDAKFTVPVLTHKRLLDPGPDNSQSGLAVFTCDGTKLAAVYGEDASTAMAGTPSWDVGSTIQPFCKQKLIFANEDYGRTMVNQPVTIPALVNDFGFLAVIDQTTVTTTGLLQPLHGTVTINTNGTMIYTPATGYTGKDTFEYRVCSTAPIVCDDAKVYIDISNCPAPLNQNVIAGKVFNDKNDDGISNDGGTGFAGPKVYLYVNTNCNASAEANELIDSVNVDASGTYQFITYPELTVADNFDGIAGAKTCETGTDGTAAWGSPWSDIDDASGTGLCNTSTTEDKKDVDVKLDYGFSNALRMKDKNRSATRMVNLTGASYAFLTFSYRRTSGATQIAGHDLIVQASKDGTSFGTIFTIAGDGTSDAAYVTISNQDITNYTVGTSTTYIRFLTNGNMVEKDTIYIDNVNIQYIKYPICYITRLDSNSINKAYYHTTSPLQHNFTAIGSQTCLSPYDFGVAKNKMTISGTIYHDANGLSDNLLNGSAMGTVSGTGLYAYLSDSTGLVVRKTNINASTGVYSFTNADVYANYTLRFSTKSVNGGDSIPSDAGLANITGNWVTTADAYGINNTAGTGLKPGAAIGAITVKTTTANITNVNFAVEQLPVADDRDIIYTINLPNVQYDVTGGLTGTDPEDGALGAGKTFKITSLPYAAVLYYNAIAVTVNQEIPNFNPALLSIDPDDDDVFTFFTYTVKDAAGLYDPTPATITITWTTALPVTLINFNGRLNGEKVDLNWSTTSEVNSNYFELERSTDGQVFTNVARVTAKGSAATVANYLQVDNAPEVGLNYYRLKIVDKNGSYTYSNVVVVKYNVSADVISNVKPNPFTNRIDIYIYLDNSKELMLNLYDVAGNMVYSKKVKGLKGANIITLSDLYKLAKGTYLLKVITDNNIITEKLVKH